MKKIKFLPVPLAVVVIIILLANMPLIHSCSTDKKNDILASYEGYVNECKYEAKIFYGDVQFEDAIILHQGGGIGKCFAESSTTRKCIIESLLPLDFDNVKYNVKMPDDEIFSFVINFQQDVELLNHETFEQLLPDFVNNACIKIDTSCQPAYKLTIIDEEKYNKNSYIPQWAHWKNVGIASMTIKSGDYSYHKIFRLLFLDVDSIVNINDQYDLTTFVKNLHTFHDVTTIIENDSLYKNRWINLNEDFYSEQKSAEEINETLAEYGLVLEPTYYTEVITYSSDIK